MFGFRLSSPGPFWFEDLAYFVIDEGWRLPARAANAASRVRRFAAATGRSASIVLARRSSPPDHAVPAKTIPVLQDADLLDAPLAWTLATEPLAAACTGVNAVVTLHNAAAEQLDSLTYALDQLRAELAPLMTDFRVDRSEVHRLPDNAALETSIEALLDLSRKNAATRPKSRALDAA